MKVEGGVRADAGRVIGVVPSDAVIFERREERTIVRAARSVRKVPKMARTSRYGVGLSDFEGLGGATVAVGRDDIGDCFPKVNRSVNMFEFTSMLEANDVISAP